jgi:hypothetical protein
MDSPSGMICDAIDIRHAVLPDRVPLFILVHRKRKTFSILEEINWPRLSLP